MNTPLADFVKVFKIGRKLKAKDNLIKKRRPTSNIYMKCSLQNKSAKHRHLKKILRCVHKNQQMLNVSYRIKPCTFT